MFKSLKIILKSVLTFFFVFCLFASNLTVFAAEDPHLPLPNVCFYLRAYDDYASESGGYLVSDQVQNGTQDAGIEIGGISEYSLWEVIPNDEDLYLIRNCNNGRRLFERGYNDYGAIREDITIYDDQYWRLIPENGGNGNVFRIQNKNNNYVMYSCLASGFTVFDSCIMDHLWFAEEQYIDNPPSFNVFLSEKWAYEYEDLELEDVEYDFNQADILGEKPVSIDNQTKINDTPIEQKQEFNVSKAVIHSSYFDATVGGELTLGETFSIEIPLFSGGSEWQVSNAADRTIGEEESFEQSYQATFPVTAPPCSEVYSTALVQQANLNVPYEMTLKSPSTGETIVTSGIWEGVSSWNLVSKDELLNRYEIGEDTNSGEECCIIPPNVLDVFGLSTSRDINCVPKS